MVVSGICLLTTWYLYWLVTKLTMRTSGAYLICLLYWFTLMVVKICNIKKDIFTTTCATCSELPSYTSRYTDAVIRSSVLYATVCYQYGGYYPLLEITGFSRIMQTYCHRKCKKKSLLDQIFHF